MDKDYKVKIKNQAKADLNNIYMYYFNQSSSVDVAETVVGRLYEVIFGLSFMPYTRPILLEFNDPKYRKTVCYEYVIVFEMNESTKTVTVTRVFHGKSNYQKYL